MEAFQLRNGLIETQNSSGLELQKWALNDINLLPEANYDTKVVMREIDSSITKVLGLF